MLKVDLREVVRIQPREYSVICSGDGKCTRLSVHKLKRCVTNKHTSRASNSLFCLGVYISQLITEPLEVDALEPCHGVASVPNTSCRAHDLLRRRTFCG